MDPICLYLMQEITFEKECRLKESMKMMGLANWMHWLAWFVKYFVYLLIPAILIVIIVKVCLMQSSEALYFVPCSQWCYVMLYAFKWSPVLFSVMHSDKVCSASGNQVKLYFSPCIHTKLCIMSVIKRSLITCLIHSNEGLFCVRQSNEALPCHMHSKSLFVCFLVPWTLTQMKCCFVWYIQMNSILSHRFKWRFVLSHAFKGSKIFFVPCIHIKLHCISCIQMKLRFVSGNQMKLYPVTCIPKVCLFVFWSHGLKWNVVLSDTFKWTSFCLIDSNEDLFCLMHSKEARYFFLSHAFI